MLNKKGSEWVSTVLYIMIGLAVMGILLAAVRPKIAQTKDSYVIEQTISSLNDLDQTIVRAELAAGTRAKFILQLSRGELDIDGPNGKITWKIQDSAYQYSEIGKTISVGNINAVTTASPKGFEVDFSLDYLNKIHLINNVKF